MNATVATTWDLTVDLLIWSERHPVPGRSTSVPGLAVTHPVHVPRWWQIVHIDSGQRVGVGCRSLAAVCRQLDHLATANWDRPMRECADDPECITAHRAAIKETRP
jgi:hypothetical protein